MRGRQRSINAPLSTSSAAKWSTFGLRTSTNGPKCSTLTPLCSLCEPKRSTFGAPGVHEWSKTVRASTSDLHDRIKMLEAWTSALHEWTLRLLGRSLEVHSQESDFSVGPHRYNSSRCCSNGSRVWRSVVFPRGADVMHDQPRALARALFMAGRVGRPSGLPVFLEPVRQPRRRARHLVWRRMTGS
jgi:hypothetical protein